MPYDSDEEVWTELGYANTSEKEPEDAVDMAPLCWEVVFRKQTQEEVLADIM